MAMQEAKQVDLKTECTTAEVTHVMEAIRLEGQCYLKNHLLMNLTGEEGVVREWHDNVTRSNLDTLKPLAKKMGMSLPFPTPLEDRENEMKAQLKNANVSGVMTKGEGIAEIKTAAMHLANFYTVSATLSTHSEVRDAFRRGYENVMDNLPRVENALKETKNYYPPPMARNVGVVNEGVNPQ